MMIPFKPYTAYLDAITIRAYGIMSRCGLAPEDYFEDEDFDRIFDFNTLDAVNALGTVASELSEQVLREIEITIKKYERQKTTERGGEHGNLNVQTTRGLFTPRNNIIGTPERNAWQVRNASEDTPVPQQEGAVQSFNTDGAVISPPVGDRPYSGTALGADDGGTDGERPAAGQGSRPDGLGSAYEQPESPSGGSNNERTDLQLTSETTGAAIEAAPPVSPAENYSQVGNNFSEGQEQMTLFALPTVAEQINAIQEAEQPSAFSMPAPAIEQIDVDEALRNWNGSIESKITVFRYMSDSANARSREAANVLRNEYGGELHALTVTKDGAEPVTLPWPKVQRRIGQLVMAGQFLTSDEQARVKNGAVEIKTAEPAPDANTATQGAAVNQPIEPPASEAITSPPITPQPSGISTGIPITQAVVNAFPDHSTVKYAVDQDGALYISNGYFLMKTSERSIEAVTEQINRNRPKSPIETEYSEGILQRFNNAKGNYEITKPPHEINFGNQAATFFTDGVQYFTYNKRYVDIFGGDKGRFFIDDKAVLHIAFRAKVQHTKAVKLSLNPLLSCHFFLIQRLRSYTCNPLPN